MRFGLFGGARTKRGAGLEDSQGYESFIEYVSEADRLGFRQLFMVEHHFTGHGQVSASMTVLAYLASKTQHIRLGTAVVVLPWHNPVLIAEQALVGVHRTSPREEEARQLARSRTRELEFAWATFLARAMEQGVIPEADPRLLTRAVLGLHNSVWHWYRPGGTLPLDKVSAFYVPRCLAVLGLPPELAETSNGN